MLQPFPDGISARRSSAMPALALGRPVVTTIGQWTESIWREERAVAGAAPGDLAATVLGLLDDAERRHDLGARATRLYRTRFALEHTIGALRGTSEVAPVAVEA
jgi:hypothetical protein